MKTFDLIVSEEQLKLIADAVEAYIQKDIDEPGTIESFDAVDELAIMSASIKEILESGDTSVAHGMCY